jgi:hypothetical protein
MSDAVSFLMQVQPHMDERGGFIGCHAVVSARDSSAHIPPVEGQATPEGTVSATMLAAQAWCENSLQMIALMALLPVDAETRARFEQSTAALLSPELLRRVADVVESINTKLKAATAAPNTDNNQTEE